MRSFLKKIWLLLRIPKFKLRSSEVALSSQIGKGVLIQDSKIGRFVHIGPGCIINNAEVGPYSSIAPHVQIGGLEHPYWEFSTSTFLSDKSIREKTFVGNDVWIGASAIIKAGINLGDGSVIGANSFVNKDVPPYAIVVGSPAKIVKYRFPNDTIKALEKSCYWKLDPIEAKKELKKIEENVTSQNEK